MKERLFTYQTVVFTCFGKGKSVNQWFGVKEEEEGKPDDGEPVMMHKSSMMHKWNGGSETHETWNWWRMECVNALITFWGMK